MLQLVPSWHPKYMAVARAQDDVVAHDEAAHVGVVGNHRDAAHAVEFAVLDCDLLGFEDPHPVHFLLGRAEPEPAEDDVARLDVEHIGVPARVVDDARPLGGVERPDHHRRAGPAAASDRTRPLVIARVEHELLPRAEGVDRAAEVAPWSDLASGRRPSHSGQEQECHSSYARDVTEHPTSIPRTVGSRPRRRGDETCYPSGPGRWARNLGNQRMGTMYTRAAGWALRGLGLGGVLWLSLFPAPAPAQQRDLWSAFNEDGLKAYNAGRYVEAETHLVAALAEAEKSAKDEPRLATSLNNLAELYRTQGRYGEAAPLFQRALSIRERLLGPKHAQVATVLNNLALVYYAQARYGEAEPLHKRALEIWEKRYGPQHPQVATSVNNLGELYRAQGKYVLAEQYSRRALAIWEKAHGPNHPNVALALNNLGMTFVKQESYFQAEPLYQRSLVIAEKALGPAHPQVASTLNNLALVYDHQGRDGEAERLYARALAIDQRALGSNHPDVGAILQNYAQLLRKLQRGDEANVLETRAALIRQSHPETALPPEGREGVKGR